jgi:hypothetical protein
MSFYILPRAENKAVTVYTVHGKDICKVIERCKRTTLDYKKIIEHPLMDSGAPIARRSGRVPKHNRAKSIAGEKIRRQYVCS